MRVEAQVYGPRPPERPSSATSQAISALGAPLGGHCGAASASEVSVRHEPRPRRWDGPGPLPEATGLTAWSCVPKARRPWDPNLGTGKASCTPRKS